LFHFKKEQVSWKKRISTTQSSSVLIKAEAFMSQAIRRATNPSNFHLDEHTELHHQLGNLNEPTDDATQEEIDQLFEEMLYWIREHDPLHHHVKLNNALEHFFISFAH
jgi:hypothetical protein